MTRRLASRITRLEHAPGGTRGPCRLCRGCGTVALVDEAAGERVGDAAGCASCGKVSKVIVLEGDGRAADAG
ncbi:MAG: hypothetical protein IPJ41_14630 [Phycisphaerales bacterium]|nr:hypothetical protein [Phycisphaerales bacterium]